MFKVTFTLDSCQYSYGYDSFATPAEYCDHLLHTVRVYGRTLHASQQDGATSAQNERPILRVAPCATFAEFRITSTGAAVVETDDVDGWLNQLVGPGEDWNLNYGITLVLERDAETVYPA